MRKKSGRVWDQVAQGLKRAGKDVSSLEIATLSRGADHLVILNDEVVGEYNHVSKRLFLYPNT